MSCRCALNERALFQLGTIQTLLLLLALPSSAQSSGCGLCASTADCSQAFKGQPGQFCGTFYSQAEQTSKPCCCPIAPVTCKLSAYSCICHMPSGGSGGYTPSSTGYHSASHHHDSSTAATNFFSWIVFLCIIVLCCGCWFACCCTTGGQQELTAGSHEKVTIMPPPATNPDFHQPSYGATAPYETRGATHNNSSQPPSGGGGGGWLSGLGGLVVGAALGSGFQRQWDRNHTGGYGDDVTGYGAGDTGGGGYDFAGDTGDSGGYDSVGDTGDSGGFDFSGGS